MSSRRRSGSEARGSGYMERNGSRVEPARDPMEVRRSRSPALSKASYGRARDSVEEVQFMQRACRESGMAPVRHHRGRSSSPRRRSSACPRAAHALRSESPPGLPAHKLKRKRYGVAVRSPSPPAHELRSPRLRSAPHRRSSSEAPRHERERSQILGRVRRERSQILSRDGPRERSQLPERPTPEQSRVG